MVRDRFRETLDYLYGRLPMYQRVGAGAFKKDLTNTFQLCDALGSPHRKFRSIHIAGTNGKGSTSHMIAAILQSAGCKTGLYTSPHLKEFTERIRINGADVEQDFVVDFVDRIRPNLERIDPSFFELTVAMAYDYFAHRAVDVAVIETGLGGRLDSTNIITPILTIITQISYDHMDLLGDTLEQIAAEKAGIIKIGIPVIIGERQPEVESVFITQAGKLSAPITFASDDVQVIPGPSGINVLVRGKPRFADLNPDLKGDYQLKNIPGVIAAIDHLNKAGFSISDEKVREGIEHAASLTGLKGRWQVLRNKPLMICDTGHNPAGIKEVVAQIRKTPFRRLYMIFGVVKGKDLEKVLELLPRENVTYYFCQPDIPRALEAVELANAASKSGIQGIVIPHVNDAIREALKKATDEDLIFIGGSTFVVAGIEGL